MVMLRSAHRVIVLLLQCLSFRIQYVEAFASIQSDDLQHRSTDGPSWDPKKSAFLDNLVANMTIPELGMLHGPFIFPLHLSYHY
jgi:hypothetical protein